MFTYIDIQLYLAKMSLASIYPLLAYIGIKASLAKIGYLPNNKVSYAKVRSICFWALEKRFIVSSPLFKYGKHNHHRHCH